MSNRDDISEAVITAKDALALTRSVSDRTTELERRVQRLEADKDDLAQAHELTMKQNSALKALTDRLSLTTQRWIKCLLLVSGGRPASVAPATKVEADGFELVRDDDPESGICTFSLRRPEEQP